MQLELKRTLSCLSCWRSLRQHTHAQLHRRGPWRGRQHQRRQWGRPRHRKRSGSSPISSSSRRRPHDRSRHDCRQYRGRDCPSPGRHSSSQCLGLQGMLTDSSTLTHNKPHPRPGPLCLAWQQQQPRRSRGPLRRPRLRREAPRRARPPRSLKRRPRPWTSSLSARWRAASSPPVAAVCSCRARP